MAGKKMKQISVKIQEDQLKELKEYSEKKGGSPISHHIRLAIFEYLERNKKC